MGRFLSQPEITKRRSSLTISFPKNHKIRQPEVCWWYRGWLNYLIFLGKNYPRNTIILEIILHGIPCSSLEGIKSIGIMSLTAQTNTFTLLINIFLLFFIQLEKPEICFSRIKPDCISYIWKSLSLLAYKLRISSVREELRGNYLK